MLEIGSNEFYQLHFLKTLIINDMPKLTIIEPFAFHGLEHLETLELKNNPKLTIISKHAFYKSIEIEPYDVHHLDISQNSLKSIPEDLLPWSKIKELNLSGNPWKCDCAMSWLVTSGAQLDKYLVCDSPEHVSGKPIKDLKLSDFECRGNHLVILLVFYLKEICQKI